MQLDTNCPSCCRRKVRLVMQTVAQPTTAAGAPAALPPTRTWRQLAAVPAGLRLDGAEREVMEEMAQQLPNLVTTSQVCCTLPSPKF